MYQKLRLCSVCVIWYCIARPRIAEDMSEKKKNCSRTHRRRRRRRKSYVQQCFDPPFFLTIPIYFPWVFYDDILPYDTRSADRSLYTFSVTYPSGMISVYAITTRIYRLYVYI